MALGYQVGQGGEEGAERARRDRLRENSGKLSWSITIPYSTGTDLGLSLAFFYLVWGWLGITEARRVGNGLEDKEANQFYPHMHHPNMNATTILVKGCVEVQPGPRQRSPLDEADDFFCNFEDSAFSEYNGARALDTSEGQVFQMENNPPSQMDEKGEGGTIGKAHAQGNDFQMEQYSPPQSGENGDPLWKRSNGDIPFLYVYIYIYIVRWA